jgi:hypothetical protein
MLWKQKGGLLKVAFLAMLAITPGKQSVILPSMRRYPGSLIR